ncbi:MAG TPA: sugar ABC transporter substrate-binding protein [Longimicrobiaceae bacterium]|nr:sugar ABC transporter substrate-binding protein [Longimicrobiaceae bacterium]
MRTAGAAAALLLLLAGCGGGGEEDEVVVRFWGMGREGEVVGELVPEFERQNPGIRVDVQQIPWSAAHEKLLTAYVGEATPDVAQLGNTWVPEFEALGALEPLDARVAASQAVRREDYFPGIWDTNVVGGRTYGIPWYVDTRVLFYRPDLLAAAGHPRPPQTWEEWRDALRRLKARMGPDRWPILLPTNEWPQPVILGMQSGEELLREGGRYGNFRGPGFRRGFEFYVGLFREGLAPTVSASEISNRYQEFERGNIAMFITGPWEIGEFSSRVAPSVPWATAPLPGPDGPGVSLAGGSSLVLFRGSRRKDAAWKLVEFLSRPEQQVRFYQLTGDLPPRRSAWRAPALAENRHAAAFRAQLDRVRPLPMVPESEQIVSKVFEQGERAARGQATVDEALATLDREVDRILEKRRWLLARRGEGEPRR